jgi:hypothetical protein
MVGYMDKCILYEETLGVLLVEGLVIAHLIYNKFLLVILYLVHWFVVYSYQKRATAGVLSITHNKNLD